MENKASTIENLFENVGQYSKTSFELYKHKAIYEIASLTSTLAVRLILTIVVALVSLFISIGIAFWLSDIFGNSYSGFFIVSIVYFLVWIVLFIFRKSFIKKPISNMVIKSMF